mgnify:CR=1 FL=1
METQLCPVELLKTESDGLLIEYEIISMQGEYSHELSEIDSRLDEVSQKVSGFNKEIDRLTNHTDGIDYTIAVASGIIAGIVDSFFVGEINWDEEIKKTTEKFNEAVVKKAGLNPEEFAKLSDDDPQKKDILAKAIEELEKKYSLPSDNAWKTPGEGNSVSSAMRHHIDDLCHHPTPIGFVACIISVLFKTAIFVDKDGHWHFRWANTDKKDMLWLWGCIIATAFLHWLVYLAEKKYTEKQYEEMPKPIRALLRALATAPAAVQLLIMFNKWAGHLCSDMAGSSGSAQRGSRGMGIPGFVLSALKELASIPPLNMIPGLHKQLDYLFDKGFDARTEATILRIAGKQLIPVLLNEIIVRGFYFVSRLVRQAKQHGKEWKKYNWEEILPFNNRTIIRMLTISHGTFVAVDLADAAVRTAVSGQYTDVYTFLARMALRVNFVGIGRFAIAVWSDAKMGVQRSNRVYERIDLHSKMLNFYGAKIYYKEAEMWKEAESAEQATIMLKQTAKGSIVFFGQSLGKIKEDIDNIGNSVDGIEKTNLGLTQKLIETLN